MKLTLTGAFGFIGTHVRSKLVALGHEVICVDNMDPQVHEGRGAISTYDVGEYPFEKDDSEVVIHLAARVGVGQSMYDMKRYVYQNSFETASMLESLSFNKPKRLVVASSMSVYGEGGMEPVREDRPVDLRSIYALTKYDQEQMCLIWGKAYKVPTVALRFFNTYGPGQSLNNPYTGVLAIFASRLLNGNPPVIYGDGSQARDFIHVDDVSWAVVDAALNDSMPNGVYNVGTGHGTSISEVARRLRNHLNPAVEINHSGPREGDIQRCVADITKFRNQGWYPSIPFSKGLNEYCEWLLTQPKPVDRFEVAHKELVAHGLTD